MVAGKDVCLRRLAKGCRAQEVRFNRFLANEKVTAERVIAGWSDGAAAAAEGRHVLAIQDTSEIHFTTTATHRRGLREIGKGNGRIVLPGRAQRHERLARLELRFAPVTLARPQTKFLRHLPAGVPLTLVDVREPKPQAGTEPLHWRLLTTHPVASVQDAWRIVEWYKRRWLIEQFFRVLKTQGLRLQDNPIATADLPP